MLLLMGLFGLAMLVIATPILVLLSRRMRDWSWMWLLAVGVVLDAPLLWAGVCQYRHNRLAHVTTAEAMGRWVNHRLGGTDEVVLEPDAGFTRRKTIDGHTEFQTGEWTIYDAADGSTRIDFENITPTCLPSEHDRPEQMLHYPFPFCAGDLEAVFHTERSPVLAPGGDEGPDYAKN